jgi:xanthine dehydrogenase molybdopterin-binding subunit B
MLGVAWDACLRDRLHDRVRACVCVRRPRYRKRGISVVPTKYGVSFGWKVLNQGAALVHVYMDGSVLVSVGGVEMGQGLHTKLRQIAAQALGMPVSLVHVTETSTDKVPNASATAASSSTDIYGGAVADACAQLNARLAPVRATLPRGAPMVEVAFAAYHEMINLSVVGFFRNNAVRAGVALWRARVADVVCLAVCAHVRCAHPSPGRFLEHACGHTAVQRVL